MVMLCTDMNTALNKDQWNQPMHVSVAAVVASLTHLAANHRDNRCSNESTTQSRALLLSADSKALTGLRFELQTRENQAAATHLSVGGSAQVPVPTAYFCYRWSLVLLIYMFFLKSSEETALHHHE